MRNIVFLKKQNISLLGIIIIFWSVTTAVWGSPLFSISVNGPVCSMTLSGLPATNGTNARYKVYLNTDDGGWYMGETTGNNPITFQHAYRTSPGTTTGYLPYFEYVEIYDDTQNPPPMRVMYDPNTGGGNNLGGGFLPPALATAPPPTYITAALVHIEPVRKIVAGHEITFIVIYGNPKCSASVAGSLKFEYDGQVLIPQNGGAVNFTGRIDNSLSTATDVITVNNIQLNPGEQRCLFLRFLTAPGTAGQQMTKKPTATFTFSANPTCPMETTAQLADYGTVALAHDPNNKYIISQSTAGIKSLEYYITFQNDGAHDATEIEIKEELDSYLSCVPEASIQVYCPLSANVSKGQLVNRKFTIKLDSIKGLKGTHQKGYGQTFFEKSTKSYVRITVPLCNTNIPHCSAIVNQAEIRFGCNPPIKTDVALRTFNCLGSDTIPDSCIVNAAAFVSVVDSTGSNLVPSTLDLTGYTHFHWYPESGLDLTNPQQPKITQLRNQVYTLIASGDCKRLIFTRTVIVRCNLKILPPVISSTGGIAPFTILASSTGGGNLVEWQNCDPQPPNPFIYANAAAGTYYFSVYDPETGCADEKWVSTMQITDPTADCDANLNISGFTGQLNTLTYLWQYSDNLGNTQFSSQNPPFNLNGKNNVVVTVTDGQGNTAVFTPAKNCTTPRPRSVYFLLAIAIVIVGAVVWRWFQRR